MTRIPLRWALPVFHLAIDLILVAILIDALLHMEPGIARFRGGLFLAVSYDQGITMMIDPRAPGLREPFFLLITGTFPAGIFSLFALVRTGHGFDIPFDSRAFLWFGFYECLAASLWFFISRVPAAYWWGIASAFVRIVACLTGLSSLFWEAGPGLQAIFWLVAMLYAVAQMLWWFAKRVRIRLRSAA